MSATTWSLPNGVRVYCHPTPTARLVHCALIINTGSRDETPPENGMAHFMEHLLFKGTTNRKAYHILNRIDSVGGELNAYTTKEKTCLYATVTEEYLERAVELLCDMALNSTFPPNEMEKEKAVIGDEIDMYRDNAEESILDDFEAMIFPEHPLGNLILGTKETIGAFEQTDLVRYSQRQYKPGRMTLCVAGKVEVKTVEKLSLRYLSAHAAPDDLSPLPRTAPPLFAPQSLTIKRPIQQANFILGGRAYPLRKEGYVAFTFLNYCLGGPAMNSRLNLNIREKYGLTYNLYSFYTAYTDTGVWGVYAGCDPASANRVLKLVEKELRYLSDEAYKPSALDKLKKQFIGSMVIGSENLLSQMLGSGKEILDFDQVYTLEGAIERVNAITPEQIQAAAADLFNPEKLGFVLYEPEGMN